MSLKKGYCTHCKSKDDLDHVFDVNPEAAVVYCPHCMTAQDPKMAIDTFDVLVQKKLDKGYRILFHALDTNVAYNIFARVLELDASNIHARFGRILGLITFSTLRHSKIHDALLLFKVEAPIYYRNKEDFSFYHRFLKRANALLDLYNSSFRRRLYFKTFFCEFDCVKIFIERLYEITEFKKAIINEIDYVLSIDPHNEAFIDLRKNIAISLENILPKFDKTYYTMDGIGHRFLKYDDKGNPLFAVVEDHKNVPSHNILRHKATLNETQKKIKTIKDKVFNSTLNHNKNANAALILSIIFFVFTLLSGAFFLFSKTPLFYYIGLIATGVFALGFIISLIVMFINKHLVKTTKLFND